eukprot:6079169-Pyramimonas_sp.AAC.1
MDFPSSVRVLPAPPHCSCPLKYSSWSRPSRQVSALCAFARNGEPPCAELNGAGITMSCRGGGDRRRIGPRRRIGRTACDPRDANTALLLSFWRAQ